MEQEKENKKKKNILYTIIAVSILLIAVSGVTYAYFAVGLTNNSDTKTTVTAVKANDVFTATGNDSLTLNVTSENMDNDDASDSYTSYTSDSTTLDVSLTAGSGTATCTYDLAIVSEGAEYKRSSTIAADSFEYTVQGKDTGIQSFAEINVDDAMNSTMTAGESDESGTQVTSGILGHYTISDAYDEGDTQTTTTQTWTITSKFYNLAHNQAEQLGKTYVHTVKVVNVKCTNSNEKIESTLSGTKYYAGTATNTYTNGDSDEIYEIFKFNFTDNTSGTMQAFTEDGTSLTGGDNLDVTIEKDSSGYNVSYAGGNLGTISLDLSTFNLNTPTVKYSDGTINGVTTGALNVTAKYNY